MKIYYNPHCNTCRTSLKLLKERGKEVDIIEYLENTPSVEEIEELVDILDVSAIDIIRTNEPIWKELFKDKELSEYELILAIAEYPELLQRPIIIDGDRAIIGRPAEKVIEFIDKK